MLAAGGPCVQLRAKVLTDRVLYGLARDVAARCRAAGELRIVKDRPDVALAAGADDLPVTTVQVLVGGTAGDVPQVAWH